MSFSHGSAPATTDLNRRNRTRVLAICCTSMVMVVMDISIVNVALPAIRRDLSVSAAGLQWTVDAYTLVLACFLVLAGSMADRHGRRRAFLAGLVIFGLGSVCCGLAPSIEWLIAARVLQALGGTMLNPVALAIVASTFTDPAERSRAIGVFASMSGLSLAAGPIIGGLLVDTFGWRSVFLVNAPIVLASVAMAYRHIPDSRAARVRRVDFVGQLLLVIVTGCTVYAVIESRALGWDSVTILGLLGAAGLGVLGITLYESRRKEPLLDMRWFAVSRSARHSSWLCLLSARSKPSCS